MVRVLVICIVLSGLAAPAVQSQPSNTPSPAEGISAPPPNLIPNGDFSIWPEGQTLPTGWTHGEGYRKPEDIPSIIERSSGPTPDGKPAVKQTWRRRDSLDAIEGLFGVTVTGLKPKTAYWMRVVACNMGPRQACIVPWPVKNGQRVGDAALKFPFIDVKPTSDGKFGEFCGTFKTNEETEVRFVTASEAGVYPLATVWASWFLTQVPQSQSIPAKPLQPQLPSQPTSAASSTSPPPPAPAPPQLPPDQDPATRVPRAQPDPPGTTVSESEDAELRNLKPAPRVDNLIPNGDFRDWPEQERIPKSWQHGGDLYPNAEAIPSTIARYSGADVGGRVAMKQTWRRMDSRDSLRSLFGVRIDGLRPYANYTLRLRASNLSNSNLQISGFSLGPKPEGAAEAPFEPLIPSGILFLVKPQAGFVDYERTFPAGRYTSIVLVTSCPTDKTPITVIWDNWRLTEVPIGTTLDRAFVKLEENPGEIASYLQLLPGTDLSVLDNALHAIFGAERPPLTERSVLRICSYVTQIIEERPFISSTSSEALQQGYGACSNYSMAFTGLCKRAGFPARMVNMLNIAGMMPSHVCVEVYYQRKWHFFDPMKALFFYSMAAYDGQGEIASFQQLLTDPWARRHCLRLDVNHGTGLFVPRTQTIPLDDKDVAEFYEAISATSFPNFHLYRDRSWSFPVSLDFRQRSELEIGVDDQRNEDIMLARFGDEYLRYYGAPLLGTDETGSAFHTLLLRVPAPGICRITYYFCDATLRKDIGAIELKGVRVSKIENGANTWTVECVVLDPEGILLVDNRAQGGVANVDSIRAAYRPLSSGGASSAPPSEVSSSVPQQRTP